MGTCLACATSVTVAAESGKRRLVVLVKPGGQLYAAPPQPQHAVRVHVRHLRELSSSLVVL